MKLAPLIFAVSLQAQIVKVPNASPSSQLDIINRNFSKTLAKDANGNYAVGFTVFDPSTSEPTCNSGTRGHLVRVVGGAGVADTYRQCIKDASDVYGWAAFGSGSGSSGGTAQELYFTFNTGAGTCAPAGTCVAASTGGIPSGPQVTLTHGFGLQANQVPVGDCADNSGIAFSLNEGNPITDIRATSTNAMKVTFTTDAIGNCTLLHVGGGSGGSGGGVLRWTTISNGNWTGATNAQWLALTN